ncbi:sigma factor G inhibitor Gin [Bacillus spongiae]|uniref:Sigma factor G inhibitor Gin n=1 Tax=Bacillus spongiae TaxID=2683610 RepID=A0ABU8HKM3_9BACI
MDQQDSLKYGETCIICSHQKEIGIHLYTSFICSDCEKEMINTETKDPSYHYYVQRLKVITTPHIPS